MMRSRLSLVVPIFALLGLLVAACSDDPNPIAAFEPEVINTADAFQFQITDASNVTATLSYSWQNTNQQATVNHSTVTTDGAATVIILDADSVQVYSSGLVASRTEASAIGAAGLWTVRVILAGFDGTANFSIEPL